jgi:hypothetical protein
MKTIYLANGGETLVSDEDFEWLSAHKWTGYASKPGYVYACRSSGCRIVRMHREVCKPAEGMVVDHINGNTLDNRRSNLRELSRGDNSRHVTKPARSSTGHRNIYAHRDGFVVKGHRNGKLQYIGVYKTLDAALKAVADIASHTTDRRAA